MLSLTRVDSGQAGTYYKAEDYYLQESGEWQGQLAEKLGLTGEIREAEFQQLINGTDPKGKFQIQSGGLENKHTAGVDLTFSAPKSVSIAGLVFEDKRILEAHNKAVKDTLDFVEKHYTEVRVKEAGQLYSVATGNMAVAKFQHMTSRELDPQLHTHCLVLNMTENANGNIRAMNYGEIYNNKLLLGQVYRSELAANLKDIGYQIETNSKGSFEIKGISQELMTEFSGRSKQIKESLEKLRVEFPNVSESKLKEMATLDSRQSKQKTNETDLHKNWQDRASEYGIKPENIIKSEFEMRNNILVSPYIVSVIKPVDKEASKTNVDSVIQQAIKVATEHEAIAKKDDILRIASKLSMGEHRILDIEQAFNNSSQIIKLNSEFYTTKEIAEMEKGIVEAVKSGKGQATTLVSNNALQYEIARYELQNNFLLTQCQKNAVEHVVTSRDRIIAIQGDAGTGKTTMLDVVRTIAETEKCEIVGLSFTGKAASEIEEASQIKSQTIASLVNSGDNLFGKLVVIDEASMLSIKDMKAILQRCDDNSRVVLIGDTKQLQTIGQGKIFSSLQEKDIISTVRMSEVQRQKDAEYKDIVDDLGNRKVVEAFNKLEEGNKIYEVKDNEARLIAIKDAYLMKPKDTIIVTATNADRNILNSMIREELTSGGKVSKKGMQYNIRESKGIVGEEKNYGQSYNMGDLIIANKAGILGKAGTEGSVIAVNEANHVLVVKSATGVFNVDLKEHGQNIQTYREETKVFAQGDKVLFLKNDKELKVKNGQTGYIKSVRHDGMLGIKMENGRDISLNPSTQYKYLSHGYALTDYKAQGQTEKHVIYHANTQKGVSFNQAYVGITRGKESILIYTDDKRNLLEAMQKDMVKTTTLDYSGVINEHYKLLGEQKVNRVYTDCDEVIKHALDIVTERNAVIDKDELLKVASALSVGKYRVTDLQEAINQNQSIIKLTNDMCTTKEIMTMEQLIVDAVNLGKGQGSVIVSKEQVSTEIMQYEQMHGFVLTDGQKTAVEHVLTSPDKIIAIQGDAGTGKTTMLDVVRTIAETEKREIVGLSFTGKAASEIEDASQIKSRTIASLVHGSDDIKGKLVVVDEASMLSIKDMDALLNRADKDTKLVLIGDTKQLQTLGQGKIFSSLQDNQIISTVRMSEVQRQKNTEYKDVVDKLGAKQVVEAFNKLDGMGKVQEIIERSNRLDGIIKEYLTKNKDTIIVTATNADRNDLNVMIRSELIQKGQVQVEGNAYLVRESKSIMGEEKYYAQSYRIGDLITANGAGIIGKTGNEGRVMGIDSEKHTLTIRAGERDYIVDLKRDGKYIQVYGEEQKQFATGDKVLFLKNDKDLGVKNGQTGYVKDVGTSGALAITMDNGKEIDVNLSKGYNYLSHGYALTDYKAQGQTEKHVIYHADTQKGVSFNQAYVGITRGKESVSVYTDNKSNLLEAMKKEQNNLSTLDYTLKKTQDGQKIVAENSGNKLVGNNTIISKDVKTDRASKHDGLDRFNKLARVMASDTKHKQEIFSDPALVSRLDVGKTNEIVKDKSVNLDVKDLNNQLQKERNNGGFER